MRPSTRKALMALMGALALTLLALTIAGVVPRRVTGTVTCDNGRAIVDIYVVASGLYGSGFANRRAETGRLDTATYSELINGDKHGVNVGCSGTPHKWGSDNRSEMVEGSGHHFVCSTPPGQHMGSCVKQE